MLVCVFLHNFAHETPGAARIRLSLRPLFAEGKEFSLQTSGASRRGNANVCPQKRLPRDAKIIREAAAYWIVRSSRTMTLPYGSDKAIQYCAGQ